MTMPCSRAHGTPEHDASSIQLLYPTSGRLVSTLGSEIQPWALHTLATPNNARALCSCIQVEFASLGSEYMVSH